MVQRLVIALGLVAGSVAYAQPVDTPLPPPSPPGDAVPVDPAARDYDAAFDVFLSGDLGTAATRLDDISRRARDPELATKARELARLARAMILRKVTLSTPAQTDAKSEADADKDDKVDGRTSFVVWNTLYGFYGGIVLVDDAQIDDIRAGILAVTATTAIGLFGSYLGTDGRTMTGAMADAYSLGLLEGVANSALLAHPLGVRDDKQILPMVWVSGGLVAAGGLAYASQVKITRGQVAFAGTLSVLGAASTGLGIGLAQPDFTDDQILTTIALGTDAGLVAGLGFGRNLDWSVSRGRIVQLGVLLGGLVGLAGGALINGDNNGNSDAGRVLSGTTLAGMWGGFAIAVRATANMRVDRAYASQGPSAQLAPMGVRGGAGAMVTGRF